MGNNYQRLFYIFQSMDRDLGNPTGYIKVELNDGDAKLQLSLNNIQNGPGIRYSLYGISRKEILRHTVICDIENKNGRADLRINLDSDSVGNNRLDMQAIDVFAVIAQVSNRTVSCPLVAYRNGEIQWKKDFEAALKNTPIEPTIPESTTLYSVNHDNDDVSDAYEASEMSEPDVVLNEPNFERDNVNDSTGVDVENIVTEEGLEREELVEEAVGDLADLVEVNLNRESETVEAVRGTETKTHKILQENDLEDMFRSDITSKFEATLSSIYNSGKQDEATEDDDIIGAAERNFREISSINEGDSVRSEFDINLLREELDRSFEGCNPFSTKSKRFKWWKINSPGYLNNILFRNNVKTYLLFNPKVMLAHYKYRYIIFGIRYDRYSGRERLVCGIPGVYNIDDNPFGNMGSWAQLEGYKPKYGAFGYWIILIDPRTGKLLKVTR